MLGHDSIVNRIKLISLLFTNEILISIVPALVLCFGLVSLCTAFVHSYPTMIVVRALLGIFEGGAMPGTAFFLSCFYKKTELFFRMSIFIASSSLASSFGGLLAAGLS